MPPIVQTYLTVSIHVLLGFSRLDLGQISLMIIGESTLYVHALKLWCIDAGGLRRSIPQELFTVWNIFQVMLIRVPALVLREDLDHFFFTTDTVLCSPFFERKYLQSELYPSWPTVPPDLLSLPHPDSWDCSSFNRQSSSSAATLTSSPKSLSIIQYGCEMVCRIRYFILDDGFIVLDHGWRSSDGATTQTGLMYVPVQASMWRALVISDSHPTANESVVERIGCGYDSTGRQDRLAIAGHFIITYHRWWLIPSLLGANQSRLANPTELFRIIITSGVELVCKFATHPARTATLVLPFWFFYLQTLNAWPVNQWCLLLLSLIATD